MLLSLVDSLRCPAEHEESPLVLSAEAWLGSRVVRGVLGCPVCHARYPIVHGAVDFAGGREDAGAPTGEPADDDALRLAAQLGVAEPGGFVLLTGRYVSHARRLLDLVGVTSLLVDPAGDSSEGVRLLLLARLPLSAGSLRAAAIDSPRNTATFLNDVVRCVRPGGRVVVPANTPEPRGIRLVARDDREWVAEVEASLPTIPLRRADTAH